jgi:hypothetical protein
MDTSWVPARLLFDVAAEELSQRRLRDNEFLAHTHALDLPPLERIVDRVASDRQKGDEIPRRQNVGELSKPAMYPACIERFY